MKNTIAVVLAGGRGKRLQPLTLDRAKPAVHFGKNRIIDFVLANFFNSGLRKIVVVPQYAPKSLYEHIQRFWIPLTGMGESITLVPPKMRYDDEAQYLGTANAVWQNWDTLTSEWYNADLAAIFGGDHIYTMDVSQVVKFHRKRSSALTICVDVVPIAMAAGQLGVVQVDTSNRIIGFIEKPPHGRVPEIPDRPGYCYASMGNYIADMRALGPILAEDAQNTASEHDFGKDIIPLMHARNFPLYAYPFHLNEISGQEVHFWRDVGTLGMYYAASNEMLEFVPKLNLNNPRWPIPTFPDNLSPARFLGERVHVSHISTAGGVVVDDASVTWTTLGRRAHVQKGANIHASILFDNVTVGHGAQLLRVICDKHVVIPPDVRVGFDRAQDEDRGLHVEHLSDTETITVIPKRYTFTK